MREAGAALQEARRGHLGRHDEAAHYSENALMRCQALPADDQPACEARILGQGTTRGSVAEGGIYREYVETVVEPVDSAPAPVAPAHPLD